ncbi:hypothetical protein ABFX02_12G077800 [Erythranthe guttata]
MKRGRLMAQNALLSSPHASSLCDLGDNKLDVPDSEERKRLRTNERRRDRYASKKRCRLFAPTLLVPSPLPSSSSAFANGANGCKIDNLGEAVDAGSISQTYNSNSSWLKSCCTLPWYKITRGWSCNFFS